MLRSLGQEEREVLRYLAAAYRRGIRVQIEYTFTRVSALHTLDQTLPALACDFLAVRALIEDGYLVWQGAHLYLTGKGRRGADLPTA